MNLFGDPQTEMWPSAPDFVGGNFNVPTNIGSEHLSLRFPFISRAVPNVNHPVSFTTLFKRPQRGGSNFFWWRLSVVGRRMVTLAHLTVNPAVNALPVIVEVPGGLVANKAATPNTK